MEVPLLGMQEAEVKLMISLVTVAIQAKLVVVLILNGNTGEVGTGAGIQAKWY